MAQNPSTSIIALLLAHKPLRSTTIRAVSFYDACGWIDVDFYAFVHYLVQPFHQWSPPSLATALNLILPCLAIFHRAVIIKTPGREKACARFCADSKEKERGGGRDQGELLWKCLGVGDCFTTTPRRLYNEVCARSAFSCNGAFCVVDVSVRGGWMDGWFYTPSQTPRSPLIIPACIVIHILHPPSTAFIIVVLSHSTPLPSTPIRALWLFIRKFGVSYLYFIIHAHFFPIPLLSHDRLLRPLLCLLFLSDWKKAWTQRSDFKLGTYFSVAAALWDYSGSFMNEYWQQRNPLRDYTWAEFCSHITELTYSSVFSLIVSDNDESGQLSRYAYLWRRQLLIPRSL